MLLNPNFRIIGRGSIFLILFIFIIFTPFLSHASEVSIEKDLQSALEQSMAILNNTERKLKAGSPVTDEINQLKALSEDIKVSHLLLQERFRLRQQRVNSLGPKAVKRHQKMSEGYREALEAYLNLIESLPYKNLNYPSREPISEPSIKPAYKGGNKEVSPDDLKSRPEAPISEEIATLAQSLNWNPVLIYEHVKNNIETEWYWGCMKGAEETLRQGSGNDCDQATLLIALLRASGFPSRYVRGTIEFFAGRDEPIEKVKNLTGIEDPWKIAEFFQKAGIPYTPIIAGGKIANFRIEHIYVESRIPYANYRGAIIDEHGKTWLGLDTSIKVTGYEYNSPIDILQEIDLSNIRDEYLSTIQTQTPLEYIRTDINSQLETLNPQLTYNDLLTTKTLIPEVMNILPASMQFDQKIITHEYTEIPDELIHKVRFTATDANNTELLNFELRTFDLSNQQIIITYEPETVEDQEIINSYGGLDNTPSYLVRLRPVLKVNGERVVVGTDGLPMGEEYELTIELISPNGIEKIENTHITGNLSVIGIVAQKSTKGHDPRRTRSDTKEEKNAEQLLFDEAINYIDRWNQAGGGKLIDPVTKEEKDMVFVKTDEKGIAKTAFRLGKETKANPTFFKLNTTDKYYTQVGENIIEASLGLNGVTTPKPFTAYGKPGKPHEIIAVYPQNEVKGLVNTPAGSLWVKVVDQHRVVDQNGVVVQYGNPISNVDITFKALPAESQNPSVPLPEKYRNIQFYKKEDCDNPYPLHGECTTEETMSLKTAYYGAIVNTILGNTAGTKYTVEVTASNPPPNITISPVSFILYSLGYRLNEGSYIPPGLYLRYLQIINAEGKSVNASKAGTELKAPLISELFMLYDEYEMEKYTCIKDNQETDCWRIKPSGITNITPITDGTVTYTPIKPTEDKVSVTETENLQNGKYQTRYTTSPKPDINEIKAEGEAEIEVPEVLYDPTYGIITEGYEKSTLPLRKVALTSNQYILGWDKDTKEVIIEDSYQIAPYTVYGVDIPIDPLSPVLIDNIIKRLYNVLKNGSIATGTLRKIINDHFPNLSTSIDKLLVRSELHGSYEVVTGVSEDASGNAVIDTDSLETLANTDYITAVERIKGMNHSDRSGDIVLIMKDNMSDVNQRFSTGVSCKSWHGSLNRSDSYVPFITSYPRGNKYELDNILNTVCADNGCSGNWKLSELIKEIIEIQYSGR